MPDWIIPVAIAIALGLALLFAPTRRLLRKALNLIPALALLVIGLAAYVLWRPVNWLIARVPFLANASERFAAGVERIGTRKTGLPAGDRAATARELWPEERYPFLYQEVPEDIRRPLWEDGKLVGGQDIPWAADRHFGAGMTKAAGQYGLAATIIALIAQPILLLAWKGVTSQDVTSAPVLYEQFPGEAPAYVSGWDVWQAVAADLAASLFGGAVAVLGLLAAWLLIAIGVGILVAIAAIEHWRREASAPYEVLSKDAHVRWPYRAEAREIARAGYVRQVAHATGFLEDAPLFEIGKGTGTFRVRGDMAAPRKGQTLALD